MQSVSEDLSLSKCESSSCTNKPVLWLKYPHTVCRTISTLLLLLARSADDSASSFNMKQSSLFTVFSPMHTALLNRLAVDLGSRPCCKNHSSNVNIVMFMCIALYYMSILISRLWLVRDKGIKQLLTLIKKQVVTQEGKIEICLT